MPSGISRNGDAYSPHSVPHSADRRSDASSTSAQSGRLRHRRGKAVFRLCAAAQSRLTAPISSANSCAMTSSVWMMPSRGR